MDTALASRLFAALSHETRLTVFRVLTRVGDLSAADLAQATGMSPSALSFHLKDLRVAGLVETRREGQRIFYSANFAAFAALSAFLGGGDPPPTLVPQGSPAMDTRDPYTVLFLCTGNSARSIMAEALLNREAKGRLRAFSAGSHPRGIIDPVVAALLRKEGYDLADYRSKSWDEFATPEAPKMDFVFTVCDDAAGEVCPVWPGQPMTAHWGVPDPAGRDGSEADRALFAAEVYRMLLNRVSIFLSLPLTSLDRLSLQRKLDQIGQPAKEGATHV